MSGVSERTLKMPALGRPFRLGMLYNALSDELIPGRTLWDQEKLDEYIVETKQPHTIAQIITDDTFSSKSKTLTIQGDLQISILTGMLKVGGSAKYLKDRVSSSRQSRVTFSYKSRTIFKQLTMEQLALKNIQYPQVIEDRDATHVVTGILYGSNAFFVFDRTIDYSERKKDVQGKLEAVVGALADVGADVGSGEEEREDTEKINCTFYGDFNTGESPTTFEEAKRAFQGIIQKLNDTSVPVQVWLYPLTKLNSQALTLVTQINKTVVRNVRLMDEELRKVKRDVADLLKDNACNKFPLFLEKVKRFQSIISQKQMYFYDQITPLVPQIRKGKIDEKVIRSSYFLTKILALGRLSYHGKKTPLTIFTIEILIKISAVSFCMIDFFCKGTGRVMSAMTGNPPQEN